MNPEEGIVLEATLEGSDFEKAGEASSRIKRLLQQVGVRPDVIRRIAISAYEAEMNVIIHARRGRIQARVMPEKTELVVADEGPGIADIKLAMKEGYSTAPDYIREMGFGAGMGLPNMSRCADTFDIQSEVGVGTTIRIVVLHNATK